ncbi:MAG: adenosyl-hopene transferase HpnH [Chlamydiae bacterium]|nr:adenosyl-hopene transferase HpnH [Chlamydiota bacterium]MBI3265473.1 adenosyl-hopene transferase HpnH [Chlamydiota bacterium]
MSVPIRQVLKVGSYVFRQRLKKNKRYPLVLMLEPLFRCNLACPGCGKIQYPTDILRRHLSPEQCFKAVEECGAPVISVAGGEPLLHPQIEEIVSGLIGRKKFIYLCTNAILLERNLHKFKPSVYLTLSIHMDGLEELHDKAVDRRGVFREAVGAIQKAKELGFRVTTNTTVFDGVNPQEMIDLFDGLTDLGVDGMMVSPGYAYEKAPDQEHFLKRNKTKTLFSKILGEDGKGKKRWRFNHSPLYLEFLTGQHDYDCTPWGNPNYSVLGWQRPCYLMAEGGHVESFKELIEGTDWSGYGCKSGNPKCQDCMVHSGYEPTAVNDSMTSVSKALKSLAGALGIR